jgi:hypothetical protein
MPRHGGRDSDMVFGVPGVGKLKLRRAEDRELKKMKILFKLQGRSRGAQQPLPSLSPGGPFTCRSWTNAAGWRFGRRPSRSHDSIRRPLRLSPVPPVACSTARLAVRAGFSCRSGRDRLADQASAFPQVIRCGGSAEGISPVSHTPVASFTSRRAFVSASFRRRRDEEATLQC